MTEQRVRQLLSAPKAVYFLAIASTNHVGFTPPVPAQPVRVEGSLLAEDLDDEHDLLCLIFDKILDWQWTDMWRIANRLQRHAAKFEPAARALAEAPAAQWWWRPLLRHRQTWVSSPDIERLEFPFEAELDTDYFLNREETKPLAAFWTSTSVPGLPAVWLFHGWDGLASRTLSVWHLPVSETARVYEIHTAQDWVDLVTRYPKDTTEIRPKYWRKDWGRRGDRILTPAWPQVARDFDGVHLSMAGLLTACSRPLRMDDRAFTVMEGWETESTLWFRPVFGEPTRLPDWNEPLPYGIPDWPPPPTSEPPEYRPKPRLPQRIWTASVKLARRATGRPENKSIVYFGGRR